MAANKSQTIRMAYIHEQLAARKFPNAGRLARGFSTRFNLQRDLTTKTIYRDLAFMRGSLGAPVEFDPDRKGYYYTEANWKMEAIALSEGELFAFYVAEAALEAYAGTPLADHLRRAFERMAAMLPEKASVLTRDLAARVSFSTPPVGRVEERIWRVIEKALKGETSVRIAYHPWYAKKPTDRKIDPYHLLSWQGEWYLVAFCHLRKELRTFKVSRIVSAAPTEDEFSIPEDFSIEKYLDGAFRICVGRPPQTVRVRFHPRVAPWIREKLWHPKQKLHEQKDGAVILEFPAAVLDEALGWVLSWGSSATVLEPEELKKRVRAEAKLMMRGQ